MFKAIPLEWKHQVFLTCTLILMMVILFLASVKEALQEEDRIKEELRKLRVSMQQLTSVSH